MKNILLTISLFISLVSFSQYKSGTIFFKDGTKVKGVMKITDYGDRIKFKKTKTDEKIVYDEKEVKSLKFTSGNEFTYLPNKNNKYIYLLKKEVKGKLDLYSIEIGNPNLGYKTVYYIGLKDTDIVEKIHSNPKRKKFGEVLSKYASGCHLFLEKIKNKKSIKKYFTSNSVKNIVINYNSICK